MEMLCTGLDLQLMSDKKCFSIQRDIEINNFCAENEILLFSRSCFSLATSTYILRAGWDGGGGRAPIRSHKRAALLHNRNRLPVIVRQNGNDRLEGRKEICGRGSTENTVPLSVIAELSCIYVRRNVNSTCTQFRSTRLGMVLKPSMQLRYRR